MTTMWQKHLWTPCREFWELLQARQYTLHWRKGDYPYVGQFFMPGPIQSKLHHGNQHFHTSCWQLLGGFKKLLLTEHGSSSLWLQNSIPKVTYSYIQFSSHPYNQFPYSTLPPALYSAGTLFKFWLDTSYPY